ncbi:MAG: FtsX-like permease family protein, partial [Rhodothermales bacterium]
VLSGIGLIVLLIACINFMTLTMGQAAIRAREIGMRKVLGATRPQLVKQFWGEALLMSSIALVLGVLLAALLLPTFNRLAEKDLVLDVFSNASTVLALAGLVLLVGLVVGSYPALALSGLHPVELIRNRLRLSGRSTLTRSLVVFQFACSVILIVSTLIMSRQLDYMQSKDLGLNQEHVVGFPANAELLEIFRNEWATHPAIVNLTGTSYTTNRTGTRGSEDLTLNGSDTLDVVHYRVDYGYLETLDLDLLAGRSFSRDRGADATEATVVNETFVKAFGLDAANAVGANVGEATIIGVVEDFHFRSLHEEIPPLMLNLHVYPVHYILVRISPDDMRATLAHIEATWQKAAPDRPFDFFFLDEDIDQLYRAEERWRSIIRYASFMAILVACLGLFGLATLTTTRRTKEIGIRKVLGASVPGIVNLLSKEFFKLVLVANVIAWPMAYVAMRVWLRNFAYRIDLGPGVFLLAALLALLMVLLTVSYQAIRTALTDPVKTLRYE